MTGKEYLRLNKANAKKYLLYKKQGYADYFKIESSIIERYGIISIPRHHVFGGYYDIGNISKDGKNLFFLSVSKHASPRISKADICLYNLETGEISTISSTKAWCWQQGARARWNPQNDKELIYNDYREGAYLCKTVNIDDGKTAIFCKYPLYDIDFHHHLGYGLDFTRLQQLRPGYGYSKGAKRFKCDYAPEDSGLYCVDLLTQEKQILFSLSELASQVDSKATDYHYLNHICVSPSGKRIMFFHLWTSDPLNMWKMRLLVSDERGNNLKTIEDIDIISHYAWIDDDRLMVTRVLSNGPCYIVYDCDTGKKNIIENGQLINDGHPNFFEDRKTFVSDTYPLNHSLQTLFLSDVNEKKYTPLLTAFSDPRYYIEKRCDMHPRLDEFSKTINLDSTFSDGVRKIVLLRYKYQNKCKNTC